MLTVKDPYPHAFGNFWTARELSPDGIARLFEDTKQALISAAISSKVAESEEALTIRAIDPEDDFNLTDKSWVTPSLTTVAYTQVISRSLTASNPIAVACCGFYFWGQTVPKISAYRYRLGASGAGTTRLQLDNLQRMYSEQVLVGYHPPIIYTPGNTFYLDAYNWDATGTEKFGLIGWTAEPRGNTMDGHVVPAGR